MSYSIYFRRNVISTREKEGLSIRETAKQFRIGTASVSRWINQIEQKTSTSRQRKIDKSELIKDVKLYVIQKPTKALGKHFKKKTTV